MSSSPQRVIVGISGSSGAIYGVRALEVLAAQPGVETHAIVSAGARATIAYETDRDPDAVAEMADVTYDERDLAAALASGSFETSGMLVAPCSMRTLSAVANSYAESLLTRAADVCLKERRRLVLMVRETPLHLGHLRLMAQATESGAVILPPVPGFYIRPQSIDQLVDHAIQKALDVMGVRVDLVPRWAGVSENDIA